ncbi:MAG: fasciclin domain-containing protein, partial [Salinibacter sp.]
MIDFATSVRRWGRLGTGLLALALVVTGCDAFIDQDLADSTPQSPTIAGYVQEVPALSSLEGAVAEAGLVGTLDSEGPFTVFAPTNDAFSPAIDPSLNQQVVEKVVRHHVVNGNVTSDQLSDGQTVTPLAGDDLTIGVGDGVTVNRASVTNANASATNGVVHVVDNLLIDAVDRATLTPRFTIFARLVKEAGLESALRAPGANDGRTIFAPTNEALLATLDGNGNGSIESGEIPS